MATSLIVADYVIVFNAKLSDKSASTDCERQYTQLLDRLAETGLDATGRPGAKGTNELLVFVKCPEKRLKAEIERERISDWLHGVCSTRPDPRTRRDFSADPVTPAERLRLTYRLITGPQQPSRKAETPCAGIIPQHKPFDRVKSLFAPHDVNFNKTWLRQWTSATHIFGIPQEELNSIKDHLGESIAYYFEFLRYYFISLLFPAVIGALTWASKTEYSSVYSILLVLWSVVFIEAWTLREKRLSVRWGTHRCSDTGSPRTDFKPDHTNDGAPAYTWYKREGRIAAAVPALLGFAGALACLITAIYTIEVLINEVYDGPGKKYLSLLPTVLFAGIVPQVVAIWQNVALKLTRFENHEHNSSFDQSLTLKLFAMNALTSFGSLTLTAFVYIPFGNLIVPHLHGLARSRLDSKNVASGSTRSHNSFNINASRLHNTLFALTTTTQVIGAFTEIGVPLITRYVFKSVAKVQEKRSTEKTNGPADEPEERAFLERIRHEASLPEYGLFVDYAEMAVQFGYVTLWSVIWPLAPLMAFINNFFELRSDAFKMTVNVRRPTPVRTETLGPWLHTLGFITWLAALTNSALVYLYRPHVDHSCDPVAPNVLVGAARTALNVTANALNSTALAPEKATLSPREAAYATSNIHLASTHATGGETYGALRATMFSALLVALASEHAYVVARKAVRHVLERLLWRGTKEEMVLRRSGEQLKVQYMEGMGLEVPQLAKTNSANAQLRREVESTPGDASDAFWARPDAGLAEIRRQVKRE